MKITNFEHQNNFLKEYNERLRKENTELLQEKCRVLEEIREQRRGKTEVYHQEVSIRGNIDTLSWVLEETKRIVEQEKDNFYKLTDKQRQKIYELSSEIQERLSIMEQLESKEIIDIDKINRWSKVKIWKENRKLQDIKDESERLKTEIIGLENTKQKQEKKMTKDRIKFEEEKEQFKKEKRELSLVYNKLNKFCKDNNLPFLKI